jgi:cytochrome c peroxidase
VTHNITVILPDGTQRNLGVQKPGETVEVALEKPGEVMVRCGIHPKMKLVVHVR